MTGRCHRWRMGNDLDAIDYALRVAIETLDRLDVQARAVPTIVAVRPTLK